MPNLYESFTVAGTEISSTYEGRHITLAESYMIHPLQTGNFVNYGDPVLVGDNTVGVAFGTATNANDLIAIDTEGIWALNVLGSISDGSVDGAAWALAAGDPVYINRTANQTYMLSGQDDPHNWVPFGYVLDTVAADKDVPTVVAVKVHWAPNFLESINVGGLYLVNFLTVSDNLEVDISAAKRAAKEVGETWGLEYAWLQAFVGLSDPLHPDEDMSGIYMRLEDDKAATGGDLYAGRFQTHANNAAGVWDRLYGLYVAIANTASDTITESYGIAIAMGGAGAIPATQAAIQIMGDGTLGGLQGWFDTDLLRGAGLKQDATALPANRSYEIPIIIDGARFAIPVIVWT